jgi:hypothetical protein
LAVDQRVSSDKARRELGWSPEHASIVEDAEGIWAEWREPAGKASGS